MNKWQYSLAAALWLGMASAIAHGESYPNKAVTLVVTAAPGGVTDILARALGQRLGNIWGQQVVVENKPGASNQIGATFVANSAPDGYTMLVSPEATFVINPWLNRSLPYDPVRDFVPITGLISISQGMHAYLKENGVPHVWHVDGNGHDPTHWRNNLYLFAQRIFR